MAFPLLWALICLSFGAVCIGKYVQQRYSGNHFPGPPSKLIIGHLRSLPQDYPWLTFTEWKKQYGDYPYIFSISPSTNSLRTLGDIIQLSVLGRSIIILNSAEDAHNLLNKRSFNYSDRPDPVLQGKMYVHAFVFTSRALFIDRDYIVLDSNTSQPLCAMVMILGHPVASRHSFSTLVNINPCILSWESKPGFC